MGTSEYTAHDFDIEARQAARTHANEVGVRVARRKPLWFLAIFKPELGGSEVIQLRVTWWDTENITRTTSIAV